MNHKLVDSIANAVLYEGYMLYPYRPSAVKNRQRWNFGVLYPESYSIEQAGIDPWFMRTECLVRGGDSTTVDVRVRFLQAISRQVGRLRNPNGESLSNSEAEIETVESLEVDGKIVQSWQEAKEREVVLPSVELAGLLVEPRLETFEFPPARELEFVKSNSGRNVGAIARIRERIVGELAATVSKCREGIFRLSVVVFNRTPIATAGSFRRERVLLSSLLSAHAILHVTGGQFVSLIDPPPEFQEAAADCKNVGTWPVLVGEENQRDAMLSSPIILYDYPQIAPESPGDLFDGTEIDEILALRILTLCDDEKREMREADDRARAVLERTETMPIEHFLKLHGVLRGTRTIKDAGDDASEGSR